MRFDSLKSTLAALVVAVAGVVPVISQDSHQVEQQQQQQALALDESKDKRSFSEVPEDTKPLESFSLSAEEPKTAENKVNASTKKEEAETAATKPQGRIDIGRMLARAGGRGSGGFSRPMGYTARFLSTANYPCEDKENTNEMARCICDNVADAYAGCDCSGLDSSNNGEIRCSYADCTAARATFSGGKLVGYTTAVCLSTTGATKELVCFVANCNTGNCDQDFEYICPTKVSGSCTCSDSTCDDGTKSLSFDCGDGVSGKTCTLGVDDGLTFDYAFCNANTKQIEDLVDKASNNSPSAAPTSAPVMTSFVTAAGTMAACGAMLAE